MPTLHEILWNIRNDDLKYRLQLLEVKPKSPRKADLIDALKASFAGGGLKAAWSSLDELERCTVAEACYAPDLLHDPTRVNARYGGLPPFCNPPGDSGHGYRNRHWNARYATRLNLFLYTFPGGGGKGLPSDLAERLREFVPEPAEPSVPTLDAPPGGDGLFVRETEHEALSDLVALLRLADAGNLRASAKTGMPSAAGRRKMLECLSGGDFFPPEIASPPDRGKYEQEVGAIKPVAWARLLQVGRYVSCDDGPKSRLTKAGTKALARPPHECVRHLWAKWLANTTYDEFNRVEAIKGQRSKGHMTAKPPRREAIEDALAACPPNRWIDAGAFSNWMLALGLDFSVSKDLWKLYLADPRYGSFGYAGYGGWNVVQHRYLLCLLFEYAATLGLVDVAYVHPRDGCGGFDGQWGADELEWLSRYDGLRAFRITNLGAYCLGVTPGFEPSRPGSSLRLTVLASLRVQVRSGTPTPAERMLLETWAEPAGGAGDDTWHLDPGRARDAVERGQCAREFGDFLLAGDNQPLPETVEGFLKKAESDGQAVRGQGDATLFEIRDPATATAICAQPELQDTCYRCGENTLAVPAKHLAQFRKTVRSMGLGVR